MTVKKLKTRGLNIEALIGEERDLLKELLREAMQTVLEAEMTDCLGASPGERTPERLGYRAGAYPRTWVTRVGALELKVPCAREGRFSTEFFERYQRSEKALVSALAEMDVQSVSTRKVKAITEEWCGHGFSASTVSALNQRLDESLAQVAERPLGEAYPYLILDARYEKVRSTVWCGLRRCWWLSASTGMAGAKCWRSSWRTGKAPVAGKIFSLA
jgi:putative transposase